MLHSADALEELGEALGPEEQRVAARDEHVAHFAMRPQVRERFIQFLARDATLVAAGDAPPRAVPAVDAAVIEREEEHAIGILVHDRADGTVQILPERVAQLAGLDRRLRAHRDRLHAHRAERMAAIDEREVIGRDSQAKDAARLDASAPLVVGQRNEPGQLVERADRVAQLPAPVAPLVFARLRKEALPAGGIGLHEPGGEPVGAREDAATR